MDPSPSSAPNGGNDGGPGSSSSPVPNLGVTTAAPERSPSRSGLRHTSAPLSHRQSFADNLRNPPPSPRSQRQPSLTQAVQGLVNHPPPQRQRNPQFASRDWHDIALGELVAEEDIRWATLDTSVEDCTKVGDACGKVETGRRIDADSEQTLLRNNNATGVVLLRENASDRTAVGTFDYNDLNAYLLVVIGMAKPDPEMVPVFQSIAQRAQERVPIPVRDIQPICNKDPLVTLPQGDNLLHAIELFGSGARRVIVTNSLGTEMVGVIGQLHLIEFFWNEAVNFPQIDRLYAANLRDLRLGSQDIIAIKYAVPSVLLLPWLSSSSANLLPYSTQTVPTAHLPMLLS